VKFSFYLLKKLAPQRFFEAFDNTSFFALYLEPAHGDFFGNVDIYNASTFSLAHGVLRKHLRED
jgi:hypothetical protein